MTQYRIVLKNGNILDNVNFDEIKNHNWYLIEPMEAVKIRERMKSLRKGDRLTS